MSTYDTNSVNIGLQVLQEWANALRGDWGSIDGRSSRYQIEEIIAVIQCVTPDDTFQKRLLVARSAANVCLSGGGHWQQYCDDGCDSEQEV